MQKVQALPRKQIKKGQYNFADLLGDINYIGDDKAPMFKSRGLGAAKKTQQTPEALEPIDLQPLMTPNIQNNDRKKLLMSKFISDDQQSASEASNTAAADAQKATGTFSIKNIQQAIIMTPKSNNTVDQIMMNSRQLPQSNAQDFDQQIKNSTDSASMNKSNNAEESKVEQEDDQPPAYHRNES